jgi:hypothetical protein
MRAADVLSAWERGYALTPVGRGESLLDALGLPPDYRDGLTVGQRDALLLDLRRQLFGSEVAAVAGCPACGEQLEVVFDIDDVRRVPPRDPAQAFDVIADDFTVRARAPRTSDLAALDAAPPDADLTDLLLRRCIAAARHGDVVVDVSDLPEPIVAQVVVQLQSVDPQADVRLSLTCPDCGHRWSATFDIVGYLWDEFGTWARHLVREVHTLASAYGWAEGDILAMSAWRRGLYLQQVHG